MVAMLCVSGPLKAGSARRDDATCGCLVRAAGSMLCEVPVLAGVGLRDGTDVVFREAPDVMFCDGVDAGLCD